MVRRGRAVEDRLPAFRTRTALWPVGLAVALRLAAWIVVPESRFASDEDGYFQAGSALAVTGHQDLFWPPLTGWLIAFVKWPYPEASVKAIRLLWIALDIGCVLAVRALAGRIAHAVLSGVPGRAARYATLATVGYAIYLPAISHAQFATSETPALLQVLLVLVLLTRPAAGTAAFATAGALTGTLILTRPSLLPLLVLLPAATFPGLRWTVALWSRLVFVLVGATVVGAVMTGNWMRAGEFTVSRNAAYNLYIGNREVYAEDLNLFRPRATLDQIEFRRQFFSGDLAYPALSPQELQREALAWISAHPDVFAQRAIGRLARVFAPKTDVLELAGGERAAGIFSPISLALLLTANLQWAVVLFAGVIGLASLLHLNRGLGLVFLSTIVGSVGLCLVAIAKPRYSFVFDPILILGATLLVIAPHEAQAVLRRRTRWLLAAVCGFLLWGWTAWLIFALSSRMHQ